MIQSLTAELARRLPAAFPACRGLVLTGSAARGEATIVRRPEGVHWLSDLELLAVVADRADLPAASESLDALAAAIAGDLRSQGVLLKLELTPAPERYFKRIRPHLFGYELKSCGRQIFGAVNYLDRIPRFDWRSIPPEEAFRLVSNRTMEWLEFRLERGRLRLAEQFYVVAKTYLDLLTALSLPAGTYAPGYRARFSKRGAALEWARHNGCTLPGSFPEALEAAFQYKVDPESNFSFLWTNESLDLRAALDLHGLRYVYDQLPYAALAVWRWLVSRLTSRDEPSPDKPPQIHRPLSRLRGWARLLLKAEKGARPSLLARAVRLFRYGSPRSLAYACAARLADPDRGHLEEALDWVRRYLPAGIPVPNAGWQDLAASCVAFWRRHLRHSHA